MKYLNTAVFIVFAGLVLSACAPAVPQSTTEPTTLIANQTTTPNPSEHGQYVPYSPQALQQAHFTGKRVVFFFHAQWCPTCKAADADLKKNLALLPPDVVVLKTDYDTEKELKEKYGVTYQHTFVHVDVQDNELIKWNGGDTQEIIKKLGGA